MTKISSKESKPIATAIAELSFSPTPTMMKIKALFYENWAGMSEPKALDVTELTGSSMVDKWWTNPEFVKWFLRKETTMSRLKYLKDLALQVAEDVLLDPDANAAAKVNMIKNILIYEEAVEQKQLALASSRVNQLSTKELEERIASVIEIPAEKK
jgi:hypothetical protein